MQFIDTMHIITLGIILCILVICVIMWAMPLVLLVAIFSLMVNVTVKAGEHTQRVIKKHRLKRIKANRAKKHKEAANTIKPLHVINRPKTRGR